MSGLSNIWRLDSYFCQITDINPIAGLVTLTSLWLSGNQVSNIEPLLNLVNLRILKLQSNQIVDIVTLVNNTGIDNGDEIELQNNPLSDISINTYIPQLEARGVTVNQ